MRFARPLKPLQHHMLNRLHNIDCLEGMKTVAAASVDLILCDLPYGTTQNAWDSVIPLEPMWEHYRRILKPDGVVALTCTQPFTTTLVMSNLEWFRYEWVWVKNLPTGHLNAHRRPMRKHETVLIFAPTTDHTYNPQGLERFHKARGGEPAPATRGHNGTNFGKSGKENFQEYTNYPTTILQLDFAPKEEKIHPTQKPLALFDYLVRTYTNEGDVVMDNCMGAGTTAIVCINSKRQWIGFELDAAYFELAQRRIETASLEKVKKKASLDELFE